MELIAPYKLNLSGLNAFLKATNSDFKYIYHSTLISSLLISTFDALSKWHELDIGGEKGQTFFGQYLHIKVHCK